MAYHYTFGIEETIVPLDRVVMDAFVYAAGHAGENKSRLPREAGISCIDEVVVAKSLAGPDTDVSAIVKHKNKRLREIIVKEGLSAFPNAKDVLNLLTSLGSIPAMGTSLRRSFAVEVVRHVGLDHIFHHGRMVCIDEVSRPKPSPEIYSMACAMHQCRPKDHVVFDGTLAGIEAAAKSGAVAVAVPVPQAAAALFLAAGASHVVSSWGEVLESVYRGTRR